MTEARYLRAQIDASMQRIGALRPSGGATGKTGIALAAGCVAAFVVGCLVSKRVPGRRVLRTGGRLVGGVAFQLTRTMLLRVLAPG